MKFLALISLLLTFESAFALTFKGTASEADVMTALRQGKGTVNGKKIIIKSGISVPPAMSTKWQERQLSGQDAPTEGAESGDVIFVEAI